MKQLLLFALLFSKLLFAQESNDKIIYLDSVWKETTKDNYNYYRVIKDYNLEKEEYDFEDYYKSGKVQMKGKSETKDYLKETGTVTYYFENGTTKKTVSYEKGKATGKYSEWYENGQKYIEGEFILDEKKPTSEPTIQNYWDKNNNQKVIDGNGDFEEIIPQGTASGKIKNGFKDGIWIGQNKISATTYIETYENGKLKNGTSKDKLNMEYPYTEVFSQPKPRKGLDHFYKYIAKNFNIPKNASNINGRILLGFVINKDGSITDLKIIKSINTEFDEEAKRLISAYPDWSPGEFRGLKVRTSYNIPLKFEIPSE